MLCVSFANWHGARIIIGCLRIALKRWKLVCISVYELKWVTHELGAHVLHKERWKLVCIFSELKYSAGCLQIAIQR